MSVFWWVLPRLVLRLRFSEFFLLFLSVFVHVCACLKTTQIYHLTVLKATLLLEALEGCFLPLPGSGAATLHSLWPFLTPCPRSQLPCGDTGPTCTAQDGGQERTALEAQGFLGSVPCFFIFVIFVAIWEIKIISCYHLTFFDC